jgi:hypothetical protein
VVTRVLLVGAGSLITVAGVVFALQGAGVIGGSFMSGTTTWAVAGPLIALAGLALVVLGLIVPGLRRRLPPRRRLLGQFLIARGQPAPQFDVPELLHRGQSLGWHLSGHRRTLIRETRSGIACQESQWHQAMTPALGVHGRFSSSISSRIGIP